MSSGGSAMSMLWSSSICSWQVWESEQVNNVSSQLGDACVSVSVIPLLAVSLSPRSSFSVILPPLLFRVSVSGTNLPLCVCVSLSLARPRVKYRKWGNINAHIHHQTLDSSSWTRTAMKPPGQLWISRGQHADFIIIKMLIILIWQVEYGCWIWI